MTESLGLTPVVPTTLTSDPGSDFFPVLEATLVAGGSVLGTLRQRIRILMHNEEGSHIGDGQVLLTSIPLVISAGAHVVEGVVCSLQNLEASDAQYYLAVALIVSNLTATQWVKIDTSVTGDPADGIVWVDLIDASISAQVGADLTFDSDTAILSSTAGGTFFVSLQVIAGWD